MKIELVLLFCFVKVYDNIVFLSRRRKSVFIYILVFSNYFLFFRVCYGCFIKSCSRDLRFRVRRLFVVLVDGDYVWILVFGFYEFYLML